MPRTTPLNFSRPDPAALALREALPACFGATTAFIEACSTSIDLHDWRFPTFTSVLTLAGRNKQDEMASLKSVLVNGLRLGATVELAKYYLKDNLVQFTLTFGYIEGLYDPIPVVKLILGPTMSFTHLATAVDADDASPASYIIDVVNQQLGDEDDIDWSSFVDSSVLEEMQ